jgi:hypothetical protein
LELFSYKDVGSTIILQEGTNNNEGSARRLVSVSSQTFSQHLNNFRLWDMQAPFPQYYQQTYAQAVKSNDRNETSTNMENQF